MDKFFEDLDYEEGDYERFKDDHRRRVREFKLQNPQFMFPID